MSVALAAQLGKARKSHTMAENTGFVSCFLKGVVDKASYRKLVADLYFVYSAMEEEISKLADHPVVAPVAMAQLNRREALEQDLTYYFGESWREDIKPSLPLRPMWSAFTLWQKSRPSCWWAITTPVTSVTSLEVRSQKHCPEGNEHGG